MKTIRHISIYNMPNLEQATRQFAYLFSKKYDTHSLILDEAEKNHMRFVDKLDSLGAFNNPEDKVIFTHLRILSRASYFDGAQFDLKNFLQYVANSEERPRVLADKYKREVLSTKPERYINYVTIPEFLAIYPEGRIKGVACNVTKAIYKNYFDLTDAEIDDADYMIMTTNKEPIRPANKSVAAFIEEHTPIFAKIKDTISGYDEFDLLHDTLLKNQEENKQKAENEKKEMAAERDKALELKEGFEAYLSKEFEQLPGHENVESILRQNLQATENRIESYQRLFDGAKALESRYSYLYDSFTPDPHEYLVDKMPKELID